MDLQGAFNAAYDATNRRLRTTVVASASGGSGEDANGFGNALSGDTLQLILTTASGTTQRDTNGALASIDAGDALKAVVVVGSATTNTGWLDTNGILRAVTEGGSLRVVVA